jgi:hypothetical protein
MPFEPGHPKYGGRAPGTPNKDTAEMKAAWLSAFEALQEDPNNGLLEWAKANPTHFYRTAFALIPKEIAATVDVPKGIRMWWGKPPTTPES